MSRVMLIGAHGKVALLALPLLVKAGHEVTGVIRNPAHADDVRATGATPLVADVEQLDTDELTDVVGSHDLVIWSAGAGGGSPERTYAVDRDAAIRSIDASALAGVARYVMVSYFGAGPDHGVSRDNSFFAYADAKSAADAHLAGSDVDWTILRPSGLTLDAPTGRIESSEGVTGSQVSRGNVAQVIAAVVDHAGMSGRTIAFNDGDQPIDEAIAD